MDLYSEDEGRKASERKEDQKERLTFFAKTLLSRARFSEKQFLLDETLIG